MTPDFCFPGAAKDFLGLELAISDLSLGKFMPVFVGVSLILPESFSFSRNGKIRG